MKSLFIIAAQRSGTNALRNALASSGLFKDHGEIFDPQIIIYQIESSFYSYLFDYTVCCGKCWFEDHEKLKIWNDFVHLACNHNINDRQKVHIFDAKINSLNSLNGVWHNFDDVPNYLRAIAKSGQPIIILTRENLLERYFSEIKSATTKQWVIFNDQDESINREFKVHINCNDLIFNINMIKNQYSTLKQWLNSSVFINNKKLFLSYEKLFANNTAHLSQTVVNQLAEILDMETLASKDFKIRTQKLNPSIHEQIVNFESEVVPCLIQNGYSHYLPVKFQPNA